MDHAAQALCSRTPGRLQTAMVSIKVIGHVDVLGASLPVHSARPGPVAFTARARQEPLGSTPNVHKPYVHKPYARKPWLYSVQKLYIQCVITENELSDNASHLTEPSLLASQRSAAPARWQPMKVGKLDIWPGFEGGA